MSSLCSRITPDVISSIVRSAHFAWSVPSRKHHSTCQPFRSPSLRTFAKPDKEQEPHPMRGVSASVEGLRRFGQGFKDDVRADHQDVGSEVGEKKGCSEDMRSNPEWLLAPTHFLTICLAANILAALSSEQIQTWNTWQIAGLMIGIDLLFTAGSFLFLKRISDLDILWHGRTKKYPGPFRDLGLKSDKYSMPYQFPNYVKVFFWTGVIAPALAFGYSFTTSDSAIAACVIPPYVITLIVQLVQENEGRKSGSATWMAVPLHHQVYRFLQMGRGLYLVSILEGPQWLTYLLTYILMLWTFNYGSLMSWLTSVYYWQQQADTSKN